MPSEKKQPELEPSVSLDHPSDPTPYEIERPRWSKPEITSFKPITDAEGISYRPSDGISNLT
jgi:hypothetical protein